MADNRKTSFSDQVQTLFMDSIKSDPVPATPLEALAIKNLVPTSKGSNTFRFFTRPHVPMTKETLTEFRARSGTNPLTTDATAGGQIASSAMPNKYEEITIDTVCSQAFDIEKSAQIDSKFSSPAELSARARVIYEESWMQEKHNEIAKQCIYSDEWIVPTAATSVTAGAITAADTTFLLTDAIKASTGIAVGDFVKLGDKRVASATGGLEESVDVVLVKTVGIDGSGGGSNSTITIETVATNFPNSRNSFAGDIFASLKVALSAHASGARVQIDRPYAAITPLNVDSVITKLNTQLANNFISGGNRVIYTTPEVIEAMFGVNSSGVASAPVANDFLGKELLKQNVQTYMYRGFKVIADANAVARLDAIGATDLSSARHYIWAFETNQSFAYASILQSMSVDLIPGTAGLLHKFSVANFHGSMMHRQGAIKSVVCPVTIA